MEEYEINFNGEQPEQAQPEMQKRVKRSPFADSPFVTQEETPIPAEEIPAEETLIPEEESVTEEVFVGETPIDVTFDVIPEAPKAKKAKKPSKIAKRIIAAVLVLALVAAGCGITAACVNQYWTGYHNNLVSHINTLYGQIEDLQQQINKNSFTGNGNSISGSPNTNGDGLTPGQVYAQCVDTVVAITASYSSMGSMGTSTGSGFIITADGYIITNHHVVEGSTRITVTTHSGDEYEATLIGSHEANDLAVLKVEATDLPFAKLGSSDDLIVGDQVVAIGNPLGTLSATLTAGYVSGKDRTISTDGSAINMIQTDAAINSGNSGGPLFNMKGEVVGITSAKYSGTTSSGASIEGIGFAIPIDDVKETIAYIQEHGSIAQPYMGIEVTNQYDGIGVYVNSVEKGGAAETAGIKSGDLIIGINSQSVRNMDSLTATISSYRVGDTVTITLYRSGRIVEVELTFGEKPAD